MPTHFTLGLVGNPNCGKTTLFNALTGARQRVGNWPGVTVERKSGEYRKGDERYEVVDLPGTYSLDTVSGEISLDEQVARDFVRGEAVNLIVNIVDASNLERNLYLTSQLVELRVPLIIALNMTDVAEAKGMRVDAAALAEQLGCPVVPLIASEGAGIAPLKQAIATALRAPRVPHAKVQYPAALEHAIEELARQVAESGQDSGLQGPPRAVALRLLEGEALPVTLCPSTIGTTVERLRQSLGEDLDILVADAHYSLANRLAGAAVKHSGRVGKDLTGRIDSIALHRLFGIPLFLLMMYLMFMFTINLGGAFIDVFDQVFGTLLVDGLGHWLASLGAPDWVQVLIANGIGGGIQTVATFIPVVGFLFLFLSVLEDSGYMTRAAFVMDRFMRWVGLPGKSFVPLIVGFGCTVPAIMATRTLEHRRDRMMTIAMAPFMSCGARLPVYVLFAAAFFPDNAQNLVFLLYLIGIAAAVLTGLALKRTLLEGEATPFIMELPPYHLPTAKGILIHTWTRLKDFIVRAGRIIVPMVLVLNVLNAMGTDGSFGNEDSDRSVLAAVGRGIAPAFSPMGLDEDNWPAAVGIFTGVLAKEAVVGTLNAAYTALAEEEAGAAEAAAPFSLGTNLLAALATVPANLLEAFGAWTDPLGLDIGDVSDQAAVAEAQEIETGTFGAMVSRFDGAAGAFAYLLFILLYMPCTAATAAVYQEAGAHWALFVVGWTTGLAYTTATIYYQAALFATQPLVSALWISLMVALLGGALATMRRLGRSPGAAPLVQPQGA